METHAVGSLRTVVSGIAGSKVAEQFREFWDAVLLEVGRSGFERSQVQEQSAQDSLKALVGFIEAGMPEAEASRLRSRIAGGSRCAIDLSRLPGNEHDPATPLGLYRLMDASCFGDNVLKLSLPMSLALLEATLQGEAVVEASIHLSGVKAESAAIDMARKTCRALHSGLLDRPVEDLCQAATFAIDDAFLRTPFLSLERPEDFYRHCGRFYGQGELDYFKCGVTSGFVIPEEYYGQSVYETYGPGITRDENLKPGTYGLRATPKHSAWTQLVSASFDHRAAAASPPVDHPYRPLYFDSALDRIEARGGRFRNLIDVERTGLRLRERAEYWSERGLMKKYLDDASVLLGHFLRSPRVSTHFVRSLDSAWRSALPVDDDASLAFRQAPVPAPFITSLLSDHVCVYTSRGPLRAINRGFWVNPAVLNYLLASSGRTWEAIPFFLLGLSPQDVGDSPDSSANRRSHWLDRLIHAPTRALFQESTAVNLPVSIQRTKDVEFLASRIIDELLRPDLSKILRPERRDFLTLTELPRVFGRTYERLRHWITDYDLGAYSQQGHEHRFTRGDLQAFVRNELAGRRGYDPQRIRELEEQIAAAFGSAKEGKNPP